MTELPRNYPGGSSYEHEGKWPAKGRAPFKKIDARIKELGEWRGKALPRVRTVIKQADPKVVEEWRYRGVPVWYDDGMMIRFGQPYQDLVKMTCPRGASLEDRSGLFNADPKGAAWRAIDIHEDDKI